MKTLVTGANGFVGRALVAHLRLRGDQVRSAVRAAPGPDQHAVGQIDEETDWRTALGDCAGVVHLAAHVHRTGDHDEAGAAEYFRVNCAGTLNLARQAVAAGVRRFVFLSSIKAMGEQGHFAPDGACAPADAYGSSKREAELGLLAQHARGGMEVVILRPPLIYGPGVGANFLRLLEAVDRGRRLPFGALNNRRSLLYLGNLLDAIFVCLHHPAAARKVYLPKDGADVSTASLVGALADALGKPQRMYSLPQPLLRLAAICAGRRRQIDKLIGSLTVDNSAMRDDLNWQPPFTLEQGLLETARWYRQSTS
ncbi:MAG: NAD-dependent epimerase/dehydratase family protein [Rhodocyclaceae bacterium]|nr:NAD-dependent epimerase/dehydratase family protein [Rhodocyclaceae bacterium]MBX3667271.1 NAD-dependent epimerase/dehydratase family protein [Rhodocyclaceae bacterium]